jgi:hypothetical protein
MPLDLLQERVERWIKAAKVDNRNSRAVASPRLLNELRE